MMYLMWDQNIRKQQNSAWNYFYVIVFIDFSTHFNVTGPYHFCFIILFHSHFNLFFRLPLLINFRTFELFTISKSHRKDSHLFTFTDAKQFVFCGFYLSHILLNIILVYHSVEFPKSRNQWENSYFCIIHWVLIEWWV